MYRFAMMEGRLDTNGDNNMDLLFSYHIGENKTMRAVELGIEFEPQVEGLVTVPIQFYWEDLFLDGTPSIDIAEMKSSHMANAQEDSLGLILMDNFKTAIQQ